MPTTERAAGRLLYTLTIAQPGADKDSKHLAQALLQEPLQAAHPKRMWQRRIKFHIHKGLNRYFLDRRTTKALGIGFTPWVLFGPITFALMFILECGRKIVPRGRQWAIKIGSDIQEEARQQLLDGKSAQYKPVEKLRNE